MGATGFEPLTSSVSANGREALCGWPFPQVAANRRCRSYAFPWRLVLSPSLTHGIRDCVRGSVDAGARLGTGPRLGRGPVRGRAGIAAARVSSARLPFRRRVTPSDRLEPVEAHHRTSHQHEREPPPRVPIPPHSQPPEATQPRQGPLDLPTVAPQPCRGLDPTPSDPRGDPTLPQVGPVGSAVVPLVSVDLAGSGTAPSRRGADRWHVVHDRLEHGGVVDVGGRHHRGKRHPTAVADQVELGSRLATIDWICAHVVPPRLARTLMVSTPARSQSSRPCSPRRSKT